MNKLLALILACLATPANASYVVTDLGPGTATAINELGVVVGTGTGGGGYIWSNGTYASLIPPLGATHPNGGIISAFTPKDINNNNLVTGSVSTQDGIRAVTWSSGVFSALPSLPFQYGFELKYSTAVGVNNADQVIGSIVMPAYVGGGVWRATVWQSGTISTNIQWTTLAGVYPSAQWANSEGSAINDFGDVVGTSQSVNGTSRPFLYSSGLMTELTADGFDFSSAYPTDINNSRTIVGEGLGVGGFVLSNDGKVTLLSFQGGTFSRASSVNDSNLVVGMATVPDANQSAHAFMFDGHVMTDLSLLPEVTAAGWSELTYANDINNAGQIVGYGFINGEQHGYLLTPVPEPSTYVMLLAGIGVIGIAMRRNGKQSS